MWKEGQQISHMQQVEFWPLWPSLLGAFPLAVTLHDKKEFAEVIEADLKYRDYPGLTRWAQCNLMKP